jgi:hypothetical protein
MQQHTANRAVARRSEERAAPAGEHVDDGEEPVNCEQDGTLPSVARTRA